MLANEPFQAVWVYVSPRTTTSPPRRKSLLRVSVRVGPRPALRQYQHVDDSVGTTGLNLGDNRAVSPTTDGLEPPWARQW